MSMIQCCTAAVESATVQWNQPWCQTEYSLLVVRAGECEDSYHCLQDREAELQEGRQGDSQSLSVNIDGLQSCSEYRAIVRSKGAVQSHPIYLISL